MDRVYRVTTYHHVHHYEEAKRTDEFITGIWLNEADNEWVNMLGVVMLLQGNLMLHNDQLMSTYLNVYLDELDEQVQIMDEQLLELEQHGSQPVTLQTIFRAAHTLKGSSAAAIRPHGSAGSWRSTCRFAGG